MRAEYHQDANRRCLVLRISSHNFKKMIPVEDAGKYACDHDHWISDCGRCWDCGTKLERNRVRHYRNATYRCLLCNTTTPLPHICPVFYPRKVRPEGYDYTVVGILERLDSIEPVRFAVNGECHEKWFGDGKTSRRKSTGPVMIPEAIEKQSDIFKNIPLGTKVKFREFARRDGKSFSRSFLIEIVAD